MDEIETIGDWLMKALGVGAGIMLAGMGVWIGAGVAAFYDYLIALPLGTVVGVLVGASAWLLPDRWITRRQRPWVPIGLVLIVGWLFVRGCC